MTVITLHDLQTADDTSIPIECAVIVLQYLSNVKQLHAVSTVNATWHSAALQPVAYQNIELAIETNRLPTIEFLSKCRLCTTVSITKGNSQYSYNDVVNGSIKQRLHRIVQYILAEYEYVRELTMDQQITSTLNNTLNMSQLSRLRKLTLQYNTITVNAIEQISQCTQLQQLSIDVDSWYIDGVNTTSLLPLTQCTQLHTISLGGKQHQAHRICASLPQLVKQLHLNALNVCFREIDTHTEQYCETLASINCIDTIELFHADKDMIDAIRQISCRKLSIHSSRVTSLYAIQHMQCQHIYMYYCNGDAALMLEPLLDTDKQIELDCCKFKCRDEVVWQKIVNSKARRRNVELNSISIPNNW